MSTFIKKARGFTLIEILIVIGIIAILASIVIIAINPAKQFAQARNTQREAAVNSILNAIGQRLADNKGVFPGTFSSGNICGVLPTSPASSSITRNMAGLVTEVGGNLGCLVPTYISSLTLDPSIGVDPVTGYTVSQDTVGRITVCAPAAQLEAAIPDAASNPICVTR